MVEYNFYYIIFFYIFFIKKNIEIVSIYVMFIYIKKKRDIECII